MPRPHLLSLAIAQCLALGSAHAATISVLSAADVVADDGNCTLREAIENANSDSQNGRTSPGECAAGSGADQIDIGVGAGGPPQTITLLAGQMLIDSQVSINGPGRDQLTIDANALSRHFYLSDGDNSQNFDVSISDLRLYNGRGGNGGAIHNREDLTLTRVTLEANNAAAESKWGGGLHSYWTLAAGQLLLDEVHLLGNQARLGGGARIDARKGGLIEIRNSLVSANSIPDASGTGAGLQIFLNEGAELRLSDSTISGNQGPGEGGGVEIDALSGSTATLDRLQLTGNTAGASGAQGGGVDITLQSSALVLRDSTISGNQADEGGGAYAYVGEGALLTFERVTVSANSSADRGGGLSFYNYGNSDIQVLDSTISGNTASGGGGGLSATIYNNGGPGTISVIASTIVDNLSLDEGINFPRGGGILLDDDGSGLLQIAGSVIANNQDQSPMPAPDLELSGLSATITDSLIGDNSGSGLIEAPVGMPDGNNNLIGGSVGGVIDPQLAPLTDNGGLTFTHRPGSDSPLIDHYSGCTGTDQTGAPRGLDFDGTPGDDCDVGAVELTTEAVFADSFEETTVKRLGYDKRGLVLTRHELLQTLHDDGRVRLIAIVLNADGSSRVLIHGRRKGERIQLRQHQLEQGRWRQGDWQTLSENRAWLNW